MNWEKNLRKGGFRVKALIKSISIQNFKGVKNATYHFDGKNVSVIGQNGAGKTTLFTAYMWLMADKEIGRASCRERVWQLV